MGRLNRYLIRLLDERFYPGSTQNWDDEVFRLHILRAINPSSHVLDIGAGAGIVPQMNVRGLAARVCGVDPDPRVEHNQYLDEGRIGFGENLPYPAGSFDVVFADNVLEHLAAPETVFREILRVLKPGGVFLAKTPNRHHYMPLIARSTPHWFHRAFNRLRGRADEDTFPTLYRANARGDLARLAGQTGLVLESVDFVEGRPEYLRVTAPTYVAGLAFERLVNAFPALAPMRIVLIVRLRKPHGGAQS